MASLGTKGAPNLGGEGEIRTHGTVARPLVFETSPIGHSGTSPNLRPLAGGATLYLLAQALARLSRGRKYVGADQRPAAPR